MPFGVYVHIPYCLQKCIYCDFATVETDSRAFQIVPPTTYIDRVKKEVSIKGPRIGPRPLDSLYFGGGTPSVMDPALLSSLIATLRDHGFRLKPQSEVTLEINPGTLDNQKIEQLLKSGFNRFSVGIQTLNPTLLKATRRRHTPQDSLELLQMLNQFQVNFSVDVLFGVPHQSLQHLEEDLDTLLSFGPSHVSPYCLTIPEGHPYSFNRPSDDVQTEMFEVIRRKLSAAGMVQYEISNFAKPGSESRHNLLYWNDQEYWGIGLSSHSYLKTDPWGVRFWNTRSIEAYVEDMETLCPGGWNSRDFPEEQGEVLERHQALTDFFHISLRKRIGLNRLSFESKFGTHPEDVAGGRIEKLLRAGFLERLENNYRLTHQGILLSNRVFEELTFLKEPY